MEGKDAITLAANFIYRKERIMKLILQAILIMVVASPLACCADTNSQQMNVGLSPDRPQKKESKQVSASNSDECRDSTSTYCKTKIRQEQFQIADKELNEKYLQLLVIFGGDIKKKFIDAQRAWISYRNKVCEFEKLQGGDESVSEIECTTEKTHQRITDFNRYLADLTPV